MGIKKLFLVPGFLFLVAAAYSQKISQRLQKAYQQFESDSQLKHAISSFYVIDAATGQVVCDKNSQVGLAPASTQKIITSVTGFELLGKDYRYKTELGYVGNIKRDTLYGNLYILASGDPTLGSWRFKNTVDTNLVKGFGLASKALGIKRVNGNISYNYKSFAENSIPDGWIWQDIGNYYGASAGILNWMENQRDIFLKSGDDIGDGVYVVGEEEVFYTGDLKAAAKNSGDNAYAYLRTNWEKPVISGTIPVGERQFKISITNTDAPVDGMNALVNSLGVQLTKGPTNLIGIGYRLYVEYDKKDFKKIYTHYSPSLDSIIYWFNKKSINLYGEALIKTFAYEKQGFGSTDSGVAILKKFWKDKGLDEEELNIYDGSGLSPLNRVTTHAQVEILKYAKTKDWFPYFLRSLPEYNGMTIKSGTISDVKGFCGYHKAKDGREYIFSFLVNNYSGRSSTLVSKMYKVLDELK
ncbi:MAG TPA: D-alanyl-D-alanine carboxypeptidase/D-alanyl-D-alanine-endopeptidase, partial [Chitinophagaceae bacterium]|nr:D-alanyl-D-alanine carboxypeptidase/D-alanyl-D-alanine-endopeptidase [Chitinophagaceae bacterium]